jgi:hypothetical protein
MERVLLSREGVEGKHLRFFVAALLRMTCSRASSDIKPTSLIPPGERRLQVIT